MRKYRKHQVAKSGFYHCYSRGNRQQELFTSDIDRKHFLALMGEIREKCNLEIHAFCLMPNHIHSLIYCVDHEIMSEFFQRLLATYTLRFNKIYGVVGHLFQGRFGSKPLEEDTAILEVSRYIHNNPVDLGITNVENFEWSSMAGYLDIKKRNAFLTTKMILSYFPTPRDYLDFVIKGQKHFVTPKEIVNA